MLTFAILLILFGAVRILAEYLGRTIEWISLCVPYLNYIVMACAAVFLILVIIKFIKVVRK